MGCTCWVGCTSCTSYSALRVSEQDRRLEEPRNSKSWGVCSLPAPSTSHGSWGSPFLDAESIWVHVSLSQDHRRAEVGKHLWSRPSPSPCSEQGTRGPWGLWAELLKAVVCLFLVLWSLFPLSQSLLSLLSTEILVQPPAELKWWTHPS